MASLLSTTQFVNTMWKSTFQVGLCAMVFSILVDAETLDIIESTKLAPIECANGCAQWSDLAADGSDVNQTAVDALWRVKAVQKSAGSSCAQPGLSPFSDSHTIGGFAGAYCFCKVTEPTDPRLGYCVSANFVPEQINLQVSPAPDVLVVAFVTFGALPPNTVPVAQLSESKDMSNNITFEGVTHQYLSPSSDGGVEQTVRVYNLHFVPLTALKEKTNYYYRVTAWDSEAPAPPVPNATSCHGWTCDKQGQFCPPGTPGFTPPNGDRCCYGKWIPGAGSCSSSSQWSDVITFRSLYTVGATKIAIFGDMGMMSDGNTVHGGIIRDANNGDVDAFVHMGDHAYQMSSDDDRRGDGYMNAYQPLASQVPWIPVIGNHEYYDNAFFHRYLNQTFGVQLLKGPTPADFCGHAYGCATAQELSGRHPSLLQNEKTTADSALGTLITRSRVVGGAASGALTSNAVPSNTSRWYSVEVGLIHMIALDIMVYPGSTDDQGPNGTYASAQKKWLEEDLAAINRTKTPWVVTFAHHPLYCSSTTMGAGTSEAAEGLEILEHELQNGVRKNLTDQQRSLLPPGKSYRGCLGTGAVGVTARADLEPLFLKYGVDMYLAGHEHNYESIWPVKDCAIGSTNCYVGNSFNSPQAPVHVVCGEGGTNGGDHFGDNWGPWTRKQLGQDTEGVCTTLSSGGSTQGGCSAGYGRITAHNASHLTYEYVLNVNSTVWDEFTIVQPKHGPFSP